MHVELGLKEGWFGLGLERKMKRRWWLKGQEKLARSLGEFMKTT